MRKFSHSQFFEIFSKVPRLCIEIVIIQNNGILLMLRDIPPAKGFWTFPGGTIFHDESVLNAVHRIAKEELSVSIEIIKFLGYIDWDVNKNSVGHSVSLVFLTKITKGVIKTDFQAKDAKFFKKLPENVVEEDRKFIEENLTNKSD